MVLAREEFFDERIGIIIAPDTPYLVRINAEYVLPLSMHNSRVKQDMFQDQKTASGRADREVVQEILANKGPMF